jgi:hypothetical protein
VQGTQGLEKGPAVTPTLTPTVAPAPPTALDRCDRCGARGMVRILLAIGGDLVFCSHHAREYDAKLREIAVQMVHATDSDGAG